MVVLPKMETNHGSKVRKLLQAGLPKGRAALLQTFPKNYRFPARLGKVTLAMQIGNALPPEFVRRQGVMVKEYLVGAGKVRAKKNTASPKPWQEFHVKVPAT